LTDTVTFYVTTFGNVITPVTVAFYLDTKCVENGIYMVEKSPLRELALLYACAWAGIQMTEGPCSADIFKFNVFMPIDEVNQPYVPVKIVLCHSACFSVFAYKDKNKNCQN
jgi:hypothetical protein